jgi:hypothetical protein
VLAVLQEALLAGLRDEGGHLVRSEGGGHLVLRLHPEHPEDHVGHPVQEHDEGAQHEYDHVEDRAEDERGPLGSGDRDVLRDHLSEHHVEEDHDGERDGERDRVQRPHR